MDSVAYHTLRQILLNHRPVVLLRLCHAQSPFRIRKRHHFQISQVVLDHGLLLYAVVRLAKSDYLRLGHLRLDGGVETTMCHRSFEQFWSYAVEQVDGVLNLISDNAINAPFDLRVSQIADWGRKA